MDLKISYVPQQERKKVLLLCDDIRMNSGVASVARQFVTDTALQINWVVVGALSKHPEQGMRLDLSADVNKTLGIEDAYLHLIPYSGYGDAGLVRHLMKHDKPDAIMIFTDPRYWIWLFEMEREIRSKVPLIYLNIWDNYPAPMYNKPYYESCDALLAISKQTENINKLVLGSKAKEKLIRYIPHGVNPKVFYPIEEGTESFEKLKAFRKQVNVPEENFVVFWNSRNLHRKRPATLIEAFAQFVNSLQPEMRKKCTLIMHTDPVDSNGTDLLAVREAFCSEEVDVRFSTDKLSSETLNYLYNLADVTALVSSNEGWGLSVTESIMAGTMVIGTVTGGIQDQMGFVDSNGDSIEFTDALPSLHRSKGTLHGEWAIPVYPSDISLQGSVVTPYIYDDRCSAESIADAIAYAFKMKREFRKARGKAGREWAMSSRGMMSSDWMSKAVADSIQETIKRFVPRKRFDILKVEELPAKRIPHTLVYGNVEASKPQTKK